MRWNFKHTTCITVFRTFWNFQHAFVQFSEHTEISTCFFIVFNTLFQYAFNMHYRFQHALKFSTHFQTWKFENIYSQIVTEPIPKYSLFVECVSASTKNSPIKGWGGLSKMSKKMSIIELSLIGQDLFDFSDLTWGHPLTHSSTHRYLQTKLNYINKFKLYYISHLTWPHPLTH